MADVLAASRPSDWRPLDPDETLYLELPAGRVVIELAPDFAPLHVNNIKTLARAKYYDGLSVLRVQENYVAQWGDPGNRHPIPSQVGNPIKSTRIAADVAPAERTRLEVIRTDTPAFAALIESRRNRPEDFFKVQAGRIELCNVPIAVREAH
jgi:cyclophilin family peptidyl-prolyl cis-trans isomerase